MAAPTPVSALVHSSTLVTAGVYLLIRLAPKLPGGALVGIAAVGSLTMFMASIGALLESDGKKIVALSTLSQLGVMVLAIVTASPLVVFFHLVAHAFFKALLFVATGSVIHSSNDYQDLRFRGGLTQTLPYSLGVILITKFRLCGLPFFSAFYSKEIVLERLVAGVRGPLAVYLLIWLGVFITGLYSLRFILLFIFSRTLSGPLLMKSDYDSSIQTAMMLLYLPAAIGGKVIYFMFYGGLASPVVSRRSKLAALGALLLALVGLIGIKAFIAPASGAIGLGLIWILPF